MKPFLNICITVSCALLAAICIYAQEAKSPPEIIRRPGAETYYDPDTKIEFPSKAGKFRKIAVRKNLNPVHGTTVRYVGENGEYADVYIYSLDTAANKVSGNELKAHIAEVEKNILAMPEKSDIIKKVVKRNDDNLVTSKNDVLYAAAYNINIDGELMISRLTICLKNGKIVKIRITYPAFDDNGKECSESPKNAYDFESLIAIRE